MSERFFRRALLATAAMNVAGGIVLLPPFPAGRSLVGVPEAPPVYGWLLASFVLLFGAGYWRLAHGGREERLFLQVAAAGKTAFALILAASWLAGELPFVAALAGTPDLVFAAIFATRLRALPATA